MSSKVYIRISEYEIAMSGKRSPLSLIRMKIKDRNDIYRFTHNVELDPFDLNYIFEYELEQMNCCPDFDW